VSRLLIVPLATGLILAVGACAEPESGVVYARYHYDEYQWVQMVCTAYNSRGICTVQVPIIQTEPERWSLGLQNGDDRGTRSVSEREYISCHEGDDYPSCAQP
jgi:hypothetical protein